MGTIDWGEVCRELVTMDSGIESPKYRLYQAVPKEDREESLKQVKLMQEALERVRALLEK